MPVVSELDIQGVQPNSDDRLPGQYSGPLLEPEKPKVAKHRSQGRRLNMLVFFGSTDEKYILIDGDLESSVRVNGKGIFRIGDEQDALYLNFTYHNGINMWGAEIIPVCADAAMLASIHVDGGTPVVEVETDDSTVYVWDTEFKVWCRVEMDASEMARGNEAEF